MGEFSSKASYMMEAEETFTLDMYLHYNKEICRYNHIEKEVHKNHAITEVIYI